MTTTCWTTPSSHNVRPVLSTCGGWVEAAIGSQEKKGMRVFLFLCQARSVMKLFCSGTQKREKCSLSTTGPLVITVITHERAEHKLGRLQLLSAITGRGYKRSVKIEKNSCQRPFFHSSVPLLVGLILSQATSFPSIEGEECYLGCDKSRGTRVILYTTTPVF